MQHAHRRLRPAVLSVVVALALVIVATALPADATPAAPPDSTSNSASRSTFQDLTGVKGSLLLDGGEVPAAIPFIGPVLSKSKIVATPSASELGIDSENLVALGFQTPDRPVVLGAPEDCFGGNFSFGACLELGLGIASCINPISWFFEAAREACLNVVSAVLGWVLSEVYQWIIVQVNNALRDAAVVMMRVTLVDMLGKNQWGFLNFSTITSCDPNYTSNVAVDGTANSAAEVCASYADAPHKYWFQKQYDLMLKIGLFLILPLMMLVAIQSIIRGSLLFLLRAFLVLLPIAIIGSVIMTGFAQVLMNVADDISLWIASTTVSPEKFGNDMAQAVGSLGSDSFGLFTAVWLIALVISMIIIVLELMLRQMGIYLTLIFIPLAYATMVYPPTVRLLKRAFTLLLGLIFVKIFIVAALSMGYAAMASSINDAGQPNQDTIVNQVILAIIVFLFTAYGGQRILAFTPVSDAVAQRIADPGQMLGMGDWTAQQLDRFAGGMNARAGRAAQGPGVGDGVGANNAGGAPTPQPNNPQPAGGNGGGGGGALPRGGGGNGGGGGGGGGALPAPPNTTASGNPRTIDGECHDTPQPPPNTPDSGSGGGQRDEGGRQGGGEQGNGGRGDGGRQQGGGNGGRNDNDQRGDNSIPVGDGRVDGAPRPGDRAGPNAEYVDPAEAFRRMPGGGRGGDDQETIDGDFFETPPPPPRNNQ